MEIFFLMVDLYCFFGNVYYVFNVFYWCQSGLFEQVDGVKNCFCVEDLVVVLIVLVIVEMVVLVLVFCQVECGEVGRGGMVVGVFCVCWQWGGVLLWFIEQGQIDIVLDC